MILIFFLVDLICLLILFCLLNAMPVYTHYLMNLYMLEKLQFLFLFSCIYNLNIEYNLIHFPFKFLTESNRVDVESNDIHAPIFGLFLISQSEQMTSTTSFTSFTLF